MRYYERENGNWDRIKEAEVEISLVKDQYILKGSVDLIRGEHDTVEIIDFKSETTPDREKDRSRIQQYQHPLEVYAPLREQRDRKSEESGKRVTVSDDMGGRRFIEKKKTKR